MSNGKKELLDSDFAHIQLMWEKDHYKNFLYGYQSAHKNAQSQNSMILTTLLGIFKTPGVILEDLRDASWVTAVRFTKIWETPTFVRGQHKTPYKWSNTDKESWFNFGYELRVVHIDMEVLENEFCVFYESSLLENVTVTQGTIDFEIGSEKKYKVRFLNDYHGCVSYFNDNLSGGGLTMYLESNSKADLVFRHSNELQVIVHAYCN